MDRQARASMGETSEISLHQVKVFDFVVSAKRWVTSRECAKSTGVSERTARLHLLRFVQAGIFDQAEVYPGHRYKMSRYASKRNKTLLERIVRAKEVLADEGV